ncbi:protein of unknown function [Marivirga sericea]|uniref:DUF4271 domain-containing protein n=1 Tax=Marivirga sericea TaxID=1028 RepID=A0A1X7J0K9_9BACT|nr:DUF4271 domain-containing protein [Marivirga sericea]SMG21028.1 protein of unknown function [Marivirga sericea]
MQKLVFLFSILLILSCRQEKLNLDNSEPSAESGARLWHLRDTISTSEKWGSDSVRQILLESDILKEAHLETKSDAAIYLFVGDKLIKKSSNGYLEHSFNEDKAEPVYLHLDQNLSELTYGIYTLESRSQNGGYSSLGKEERARLWVSDNILLILLLGASLFMVIIKINYDKRYINILSFNKIFTTRLNEGDQSRVRIMDEDNLVFAGFYAFLTAGLIYFLDIDNSLAFFGIGANGIIEYLKILSIVAIGLIAKVILISIASNLFGNSKIPAFYVKEMLNINLFFIIILFFSSILIYLFLGSIPAFWLSVSTYALLLFYILRLVLLYFKILKLSSFTNLYLFSYFCTTEIFPFLIGLKYFLR